jgi:hypothetical protein
MREKVIADAKAGDDKTETIRLLTRVTRGQCMILKHFPCAMTPTEFASTVAASRELGLCLCDGDLRVEIGQLFFNCRGLWALIGRGVGFHGVLSTGSVKSQTGQT